MIKKKKNKIYTKISLIVLVLVFCCSTIGIGIARAEEVTGCCMYAKGEDDYGKGGCIDGWTKMECGGDAGKVGGMAVKWQEEKFCKSIDDCIANNDDNPIKLSIPIGNVREIKDLSEYIRVIYTWSIGAIAVIAVVMIMIAGFQWLFAVGNEKEIN